MGLLAHQILRRLQELMAPGNTVRILLIDSCSFKMLVFMFIMDYLKALFRSSPIHFFFWEETIFQSVTVLILLFCLNCVHLLFLLGSNPALQNRSSESDNRNTVTDSSTPSSARPRPARQFGSNIHTLRHDGDSSSDKNVFWNGNSTQFGGDDKK